MDECEADHHTQEQLGVGVDFYEIRHKRLTTIDEPRDPLVLVVDTKILQVMQQLLNVEWNLIVWNEILNERLHRDAFVRGVGYGV